LLPPNANDWLSTCFSGPDARSPGATNASIGVHVAFQDSQPLILFVGDVDRSMRDREGFQEIDFPAFFSPIAKWAARIEESARIPEYIARAYATAISGRPGPVVLALPEDMLHESGLAASPRPFVHRPAQAPCPDAMAAMIALLADAAAPVAIRVRRSTCMWPPQACVGSDSKRLVGGPSICESNRRDGDRPSPNHDARADERRRGRRASPEEPRRVRRSAGRA
jgi:hypothetical protein